MDLKKDLDEYLLLQSDQKKQFKLTLPANFGQKSKQISGWFRRGESSENGPGDTGGRSWFEETRQECCPGLSRMQRIVFFVVCLGMGCLCFTISLMYIPVLLFKARKFALLFTLGSLFIILSFLFLWGPMAYLRHMFSRERLFSTLSYGGTLCATLYCALHLQSTPLTVLFAVGQIISLLWTVLANVPGGATGLSFFSKVFSRTASSALPV